MQLTQAWTHASPKLKLVYNRFTLSRIATAYFALTLAHCVIQTALQIRGHTIDHHQSIAFDNIINGGNVTDKFAILDANGSIVLCRATNSVNSDPNPCKRFPGPDFPSVNTSVLSQDSIETFKRAPGENDVQQRNNLGTRQPTPRLPGAPSIVVQVDSTCIQVLTWPAQMQVVSLAKRESVATVAFQIWLFGISIVAILTESIPHVMAALVTHILSTAWAAYQIARVHYMERRYQELVVDLACSHVDFMPTFWRDIQSNQIPILILNIVSLVASSCLSQKLCKQFDVQTFARVGGSRRINHLYLLVLVLSVNLQLTMFFLVASLVLWIEQLYSGPIGALAGHRLAYLAGFIVTVIVIHPWLYMGWTAVRREQRHKMTVFFVVSVFLIFCQTAIFLSPVYRVTFSTWPFFGTITVMAYVLLTTTFLAAIVCRYFFGRGLAHFLQVQEVLEECDFTPVYLKRGSFVSVKINKGRKGEREGESEQMETLPWDVEGRGVVKKMSLWYPRQSRDTAELPSTPVPSSPAAAMLSVRGSQTTFRFSGSQDTLQTPSHQDAEYQYDREYLSPPPSSSSVGRKPGSRPPGLSPNALLHRGSMNTEPFPMSFPPSPLPRHSHSFPSTTGTGLPTYVTPAQMVSTTVKRPSKLAITIPDARRVSY